MKILKIKSRKYKKQQYHKYRINLPEKDLAAVGFKEGDELEASVRKGRIVLRKKFKGIFSD